MGRENGDKGEDREGEDQGREIPGTKTMRKTGCEGTSVPVSTCLSSQWISSVMMMLDVSFIVACQTGWEVDIL